MISAGRPDCLVLATSGRLLAESLSGAGLTVDVGDSFADLDCQAAARCCTQLPMAGPADPAPESGATLDFAQRWAASHPGGRLVVGAGFEHRADLLARLAASLPLAGTPAAAVAACKDPWQLAQACQAVDLPHPELRTADQPGDFHPADWLVRRPGSSGGHDLQHASSAQARRDGRVLQRWIAGDPVSVLFHAEPGSMRRLSVQRQFLAGSPLAPFRFGGVVRAPELAPAAVAALDHCATALASHFGLRGINGLDGLWDGNQLWVLEINPRPTASLALLDPRLQAAALRAHLQTAPGAAGSRPDWPAALPRLTDALNPGMAVVYASAQLSIPADFRFPPGCHDLPVLPRVFAAGDPVCSVQVRTGGIEELRALIRTLRECLFALAGADLLSSL